MEIKLIKTSKALSPTNMTISPYVINPYRGCEFNCLYCYTRSNKNFTNASLGIKENIPLQLDKELKTKNISHVLLGSSCECFTYSENKFKLSENILKTLNKHNVSYTILTKSPLISNYLDLISFNKKNRIFFTYNVDSEKIKSLLEESSPTLDERIKAIDKISTKRIDLRIHIGPFLPYISNLENIFELFKNKVKKINIELYHSKLGNFEQVIGKIEKLDTTKALLIKEIYSCQANYVDYADELKESAIKLNENYNYKLFFITPDFNDFYNSKINYE